MVRESGSKEKADEYPSLYFPVEDDDEAGGEESLVESSISLLERGEWRRGAFGGVPCRTSRWDPWLPTYPKSARFAAHRSLRLAQPPTGKHTYQSKSFTAHPCVRRLAADFRKLPPPRCYYGLMGKFNSWPCICGQRPTGLVIWATRLAEAQRVEVDTFEESPAWVTSWSSLSVIHENVLTSEDTMLHICWDGEQRILLSWDFNNNTACHVADHWKGEGTGISSYRCQTHLGPQAYQTPTRLHGYLTYTGFGRNVIHAIIDYLTP
ncbi:uncharacterized protein CLUP02_03140 [Colletotrichum lupini]|uniref:Uncharacterized protein n=1 Tax=Colletotrichum lupini TaxID=145971 RepID=A0A9Q8SIA1_9PEZI|nr:uncharacterized protein CLUP02_03140 [Colletotrichum lupini]UQC77670.1 hypothetical protein CLUP02_03140 [Colletotrichum lupini]